KCAVDAWLVLMRSQLPRGQYKRIKHGINQRAFVKYIDFLKQKKVFCKADDLFPKELDSAKAHENLAILRFLKSCKEEYCANAEKGRDSGVLSKQTAADALAFGEELNTAITESSKVYHRFLKLDLPIKKLKQDLTVIGNIPRPKLEAEN